MSAGGDRKDALAATGSMHHSPYCQAAGDCISCAVGTEHDTFFRSCADQKAFVEGVRKLLNRCILILHADCLEGLDACHRAMTGTYHQSCQLCHPHMHVSTSSRLGGGFAIIWRLQETLPKPFCIHLHR